jgi:ATP-binding cassette, subfamily B, multidrug efflux pump
VIILASFGGYLALQGLVTVGTIATFIFYGQELHRAAAAAGQHVQHHPGCTGRRRARLRDHRHPARDAGSAGCAVAGCHGGDVRFEHVSFGYQPGQPVIKDMSLEARAGQTIALVGPTGAGKTTIINLLTRFYEIQSGRITIDGKDIRQVRKADLRRNLGIVLQDTFLFADTVMENIRYGRLDASDEEASQAASWQTPTTSSGSCRRATRPC